MDAINFAMYTTRPQSLSLWLYNKSGSRYISNYPYLHFCTMHIDIHTIPDRKKVRVVVITLILNPTRMLQELPSLGSIKKT